MTKYKIEGGINFFEELYKSLDIEENESKTEEDNKLCLITNQPLTDFFVEMKCGHKFNYLPLYYDIKNHKQKYNNLEGNSGRLSTNEIRCPYCRKKQSDVLPFHEELKLEKINGVNFYDPNLKTQSTSSGGYHHHYCEFLTPNPNYDPSGNNPVETSSGNGGNCKFLKCFHYGSKLSNYDLLQINGTNNDKNYCWNHKKAIIKNYKKELKEKEKAEAKKAKEEAKKKAAEEKLKAKEDAKKAKAEAKNSKKTNITFITPVLSSENIVIGQMDLSGNVFYSGCIQILKTGANKGNQCGCKIVSENMCKRHFLMNHKELILNN